VSDCYADNVTRGDVKSSLGAAFQQNATVSIVMLQVPTHCTAPGVEFCSNNHGFFDGGGRGGDVIDADIGNTSMIDNSYRRNVKWDSPLFLIYTSGTTGLPKASKINHLRFWSAGLTIFKLCNLEDSDRLYTALPLYHASGGMMAVSAIMLAGAALVVRPKFSASNFSRDLSVHK